SDIDRTNSCRFAAYTSFVPSGESASAGAGRRSNDWSSGSAIEKRTTAGASGGLVVKRVAPIAAAPAIAAVAISHATFGRDRAVAGVSAVLDRCASPLGSAA